MNDIRFAIQLSEKIIAFAVFLQSLEMILIKDSFSDFGIWRWETLKNEFKIFSKFHQYLLGLIFKYQNFLILIYLRVFFSFVLLFYTSPFILGFLLISTVLISLRWRGTFNGGSDYVSVLILAALCVTSSLGFSERSCLFFVWYVAIQVVSSYFIAGIVKIKNLNWLNGKALRGFLNSTIYTENRASKLLLEHKSLVLAGSWTIIIFEVSFVLTFWSQQVCLIYMGLAILFHLGNFYFFGLNRFIFAWLACYPALYFCAGSFR